MLELALHVLDIVENSIRARARNVTIEVVEDWEQDRISIQICDDGEGMPEEIVKKALDPFFTSKEVRRIGLGLPLLQQATEMTCGRFILESQEGKGTRVYAEFLLSHADRQPLGDIASTLITLIGGNPEMNFTYHHRCGKSFSLDTQEIKKQIENVPIYEIEILNFIRQYVKEGIAELGSKA